MTLIRERLDKILEKIQSPAFLANKGLGNEIGFYIFDYDPSDELIVREHIAYLKRALFDGPSSRKVIEFDLYDMMLALLKHEGVLEDLPQIEAEQGSMYISEALRDIASPEVYVEQISDQIEGADMVFLTGVGKVWPMVRSHNILNNLHHVLDKVPVIMFFPGNYDGAELRLFNKLKDDNYYRAFRLIEK
ncbi:DUF1788 domain-containing protein [Desulfosporosinus metallidurans]|uniref:Putative cytoplasmic protein n=1 Tax=Desulfosporosinus metallidurans TaxID=1888891 RepID=A0A1Q8QKU5_9FIRM|nr:DUF1788 domain-containing protein [Desulfosporosinus metallidurans]OLN27957.1 putative cytoplasmic protein [Desulfosporosinus metallidurans]